MADFGLGVAETTLGRLKQLAAECGKEVRADLEPCGVRIVVFRAVEGHPDLSTQRTLSWAGLEGPMDQVAPTLVCLRGLLRKAEENLGPSNAA